MSDFLPERLEPPRAANTSKAGTSIYKYETPAEKPEVVHGDPLLIKAIEKHIDLHLGGASDWVFHEIVSTTIHVDIHIVPPTEERPFYVLVTSGMAERPMTSPPEAEGCEFAELCICLPPDWPGLSEKARTQSPQDADHPWKDENNYWPIRTLKSLARFPHEYKTWLWFGHTTHNGNPPEPYSPGTRMCAAMVDFNPLFPKDFHKLSVGDRDIAFLTIYPLYEEEVQYKLDHGYDAFIAKMDAANVTAVIDPQRPSFIRPAKPWWKFW